jgi:hypothetical protein
LEYSIRKGRYAEADRFSELLRRDQVELTAIHAMTGKIKQLKYSHADAIKRRYSFSDQQLLASAQEAWEFHSRKGNRLSADSIERHYDYLKKRVGRIKYT